MTQIEAFILSILAITIDDSLVAALVPVAFVMLVSLMVWIIRELGRLSQAVSRLAEAVENQKDDIAAIQVMQTGQQKSLVSHSSKLAWIEGRLMHLLGGYRQEPGSEMS